jgi:hypothetical protein
MTDARQSWDEVGEILEGLGLKLKMHAEAARAELDGEKLDEALKEAGDSAKRAFEALENVVRDPAVKDDLRRAATAFSDALSNTFSEVAAQVRSRRSTAN